MQHYPASRLSYVDVWHEDVRPELVAPIERSAQAGDYGAVDLLSIYYASLQLVRHATRSGTAAAVWSARTDVATAERLLLDFAITQASHDRASSGRHELTPVERTVVDRPFRRRPHCGTLARAADALHSCLA